MASGALDAFEAAKKRRRVEAAATVVATERPSSTDNGAQQEDGDGDGEYAEGDYDEGEEGGEDYFEDGEEDYDEEEVGVSEEVIERLSGKDALFELLGVKKDVGGRVQGGEARILAKFHASASRFGVSPKGLQGLCLALSVLRDPIRRQIYVDHGMKGLLQSESYAALSVFDQDAAAVREHFYSGEDPQAREFLMLHGTGGDSSDDESPMVILPPRASEGGAASPPPKKKPTWKERSDIGMARTPTPPPLPPSVYGSGSATSASTKKQAQAQGQAKEKEKDKGTETERARTLNAEEAKAKSKRTKSKKQIINDGWVVTKVK